MRVVVLEPDGHSAKILSQALGQLNIHVVCVSTAQHALEQVEPGDVVITELSLPGHSGMEFLYELRTYAELRSVPVFVYSAIVLSREVLSSAAWGLLDVHYFYKPRTKLTELTARVSSAVQRTVAEQ